MHLALGKPENQGRKNLDCLKVRRKGGFPNGWKNAGIKKQREVLSFIEVLLPSDRDLELLSCT